MEVNQIKKRRGQRIKKRRWLERNDREGKLSDCPPCPHRERNNSTPAASHQRVALWPETPTTVNRTTHTQTRQVHNLSLHVCSRVSVCVYQSQWQIRTLHAKLSGQFEWVVLVAYNENVGRREGVTGKGGQESGFSIRLKPPTRARASSTVIIFSFTIIMSWIRSSSLMVISLAT